MHSIRNEYVGKAPYPNYSNVCIVFLLPHSGIICQDNLPDSQIPPLERIAQHPNRELKIDRISVIIKITIGRDPL